MSVEHNEITAEEGNSVTVRCLYSEKHRYCIYYTSGFHSSPPVSPYFCPIPLGEQKEYTVTLSHHRTEKHCFNCPCHCFPLERMRRGGAGVGTYTLARSQATGRSTANLCLSAMTGRTQLPWRWCSWRCGMQDGTCAEPVSTKYLFKW